MLAGTTEARPVISGPPRGYSWWDRELPAPSLLRLSGDPYWLAPRPAPYPRARGPLAAPEGPIQSNWAQAISGNWSEAARWSTNPFAPNNGNPAGASYHAVIGATGSAYTVTLDSAVTLDALTLGSANATLRHTAGVLEIGGAFDVTAGQYLLDGGTLRGATLAFAGGSFAATANANNRFDGVTVNGNWSLPSGAATLRVSNGLTLGSGGVLSMSTTFGHQLLSFDGDQTLSGGTVVLDAALPQQFASAAIAVEGNATLTIAPGTTVRGGWGTIGSQGFVAGDNAVVNQGTISAQVASRSIRIVSDSFTNEGLAEAKNGGTLDIQSANWTNSGTIASTGSTLTLAGAWTNSGAINATNSTVNLLGAWSNLGTLTATNSTVNLGGTFTGASVGTFNRTGGTVNITGTLANTGQVLGLNAGTGSWRLQGGTITGGTITQTGGASLIVAEHNANRLVGVSISGDLNLLESNARAIVNDGLSVSGTTRLGQTAELSFVGDQTVQGGAFQIQGNNARLRAGGAVELAPGTLVTNFGSYSWTIMDAEGPALGNLTNRGTIRSTGTGSHLDFLLADFTNVGTLEALNGGRVQIGGSSVAGAVSEWSNPGLIRVNNGTLLLNGRFSSVGTLERTGGTVGLSGILENEGSVLTLDAGTGSWEMIDGTIRGGTVNLTQGAGLLFNSIPGVSSYRRLFLEGVTLNGDLTLGTGSMNFEPYLGVRDGLALDGTIAMTGANTRIVFHGGDQTFSGGTIAMESGASSGQRPWVLLATSAAGVPASMTIAADATIRGGNAGIGAQLTTGSDTVTLINEGRISSDIEFVDFDVTPTVLDNRGTLEVLNGGILSIAPKQWINSGLIRVIGGTLHMGGTSSTSSFTLGPGTVFERQGGQVNIQGHLINTGQNLTLNTSTGSWRLTGGSISGGVLNLQQGAQIVPAQGFNGFGGQLRGLTINGDLPAASGLTFLDGLTLNGTANVNGTVKFGIAGTSQTISAGEFWFDPQVTSTRHMIVPVLGTQTFAPGTLIHGGNGRVGYEFGVGANYTKAVLRNQGTIAADAIGEELILQPGKLVNEGVIEAVNGGRLEIHHDTTWSNTNGVIRALPGSTLELGGKVKTSELGQVRNEGGEVFFRGAINNTNGHLVIDSGTGSWQLVADGTVKGGQVSQLDGERLTIGGGTFLENVHFNQDLWFGSWFGSPDQSLVRNGLSVDGTVHLTYPGNAITFEGNQTFDDATIAMETTSGEATLVRSIGQSTLTLGANGIVRGGRGVIYTDTQSSFENDGLISADVPAQVITIHTARFQNNGTVQAVNGGGIVYFPPPLAPPPEPPTWTNAGTLSIGAGSVAEFGAEFIQTETGALRLALAGAGSWEGYGRFVGTGLVALDGALILTLANGYAPEAGAWFDVIDWPGVVEGEFYTYDLPALAPGLYWDLSALYSGGVVSVVPSPGSLALLGAGALLACGRRPSRRSPGGRR